MKTIKKDELYLNLSGFLKSKGIELQDGSYSQRIQKGCGFLADAVNATQRAAKRAKVTVDEKLDQLRQGIHKATAPKADEPKPAPGSAKSKAKAAPRKAARARPHSRRK